MFTWSRCSHLAMNNDDQMEAAAFAVVGAVVCCILSSAGAACRKDLASESEFRDTSHTMLCWQARDDDPNSATWRICQGHYMAERNRVKGVMAEGTEQLRKACYACHRLHGVLAPRVNTHGDAIAWIAIEDKLLRVPWQASTCSMIAHLHGGQDPATI
jgi:hypothetical protein